MDKIAVVILNWNGCEMLRSFLPSVVRCSGTEGAKIYVADNGSTDASVDMLRKEFPDVHLIILKENLGFAEGYNLALQQVSAEYVVLLNSDVEVTEHWLAPLVHGFGKGEVKLVDPHLGGITVEKIFGTVCYEKLVGGLLFELLVEAAHGS